MNSIKDSSTITDISLRQAARTAGISYLLIFIVTTLADLLIGGTASVVLGDVTTTVDNIVGNETLFRLGVAGWIVVMLIDVIVAWALYVFLKPVNRSLALLAAWFRLMYVVILGSSLVNHFSVLGLLSGADHLAVIETSHLHAQVMELLDAHKYALLISFLFFGIHIFLLGCLILKSDYIPLIIGVLLVIASIGYLIECFGNFLSSSYASNLPFLVFVGIPAVIAEFSLTLWLLFKGGKIHEPTGGY